MKVKFKLVILFTLIIFSILPVYLFRAKSIIEIPEGEYYEPKSVIVNYFDKLLSKKYHQLELGANDIFFDEKIIKDIKLLKISDKPVKGRADTEFLLDKYDNLEDVLVFEITYEIKYENRFRYLFQSEDGELNQYLTLIKLKNSNTTWLIEEIGY